MTPEQAGEIIEGMRGVRRDIDDMKCMTADNTRAITQMLVALESKSNKSDCKIHSGEFAATYVTKTEFAPYAAGVKWCAAGALSALGWLVKLAFFGGSVIK